MRGVRRESDYDLVVLKQLFIVAKDASGAWRLFHVADRGRRAKAGYLADTSMCKGRRTCRLPVVDGKQRTLYASCVIWMLINDRSLPPGRPIDHANRDRIDNSPTNLAPVTHQANATNRPSSDGRLIGVQRQRQGGNRPWQAIATDPDTGLRVSLKYHQTAEDAARAYDAFVIKTRGAEAVTNASLGRLT